MQRLTLNELTAITDIHTEELKSKRRRGQLALAFSRTEATARLRYTAVDCVAVLLTKELAEVYGAKQAARLIVMFGDVVLRAIAEAEADTTADVMLTVADVASKSDDRRGHLATYLARNRADTIEMADYTVERIVSTNVSRTIRAVRASAFAERIDLSDPFMPAPGSVAFDEIMAAYAELPAGIVEAGAYRKREGVARRAGERARAIAMGGAGHPRGRMTDMTDAAAI